MLLLPAAALVDCLLMEPGTYGVVRFLGQELVFGRVDRLSLVFSYVFSLLASSGWSTRSTWTTMRSTWLR